MVMSKHVIRLAALAAMLLAGSCASPSMDNNAVQSVDPDVLHPITVQPDYRTVRLSYAGGNMDPQDASKLDHLVSDYMDRGTGSLSVSVPEGSDSSEAISFFGETLAHMGAPRSKIMVGTHPVTDGDRRVEISFVGYVAHTEPCGDWSRDATDTEDNLPMPNFGCAVQHNIAAMVDNPRDLDESRRLDNSPDATRRAAVLGHYEKGEATQAQKHTYDTGSEQSAPGSGIGN
jgi:pilus assembly protein CpaD